MKYGGRRFANQPLSSFWFIYERQKEPPRVRGQVWYRQQLRLFMQHVKTSLFLLRNLTNPEYTKAGCRETAAVWPREHAGWAARWAVGEARPPGGGARAEAQQFYSWHSPWTQLRPSFHLSRHVWCQDQQRIRSKFNFGEKQCRIASERNEGPSKSRRFLEGCCAWKEATTNQTELSGTHRQFAIITTPSGQRGRAKARTQNQTNCPRL